ncbi:SWIM zinc finger family protein [Streptomyces sp. NPDC086549]|uniref:SWIM zinc finger family protein n=1 Tax=Streptomyces sp. NPDC086549 TaxID=3365752 RepID=UPI00380D963F
MSSERAERAGGPAARGRAEGGTVETPVVGGPRPGDAARAALRSAVSARRASGAGPDDAAGSRRVDTDDAAGSRRVDTGDAAGSRGVDTGDAAGSRGVEVGAAAGAAAGADETGDRPAPRDAPGARGAARTGGRPGDAAREALRAARRESVKAEADAVSPGGADTARRPVSSARSAFSSSSPSRPSRLSRPEPSASRAGGGAAAGRGVDRARVARDIREFLSGAFRMPSATDGPGEGAEAHAQESQGTSATFTGAPTHAADALSHPAAPSTISAEAPAPPPVPRTMATPHRDGELRRTFPAFRPRTPKEGAGFADTWWGNAWVDALERGALDVKRLARGRGYAERGQVDAITVTPGLVLAYVQGSRPRPYRVQVRLRTLGEADWDRFLDAAADRPGHIAALLDRELPQSLADCGVPLLPGPGDLEPRCSCPDSGHPCKHAAALCYQTARLLDADPFVLLLLRGRGERELLDALSRRNAARAARAAQEQGPAPLPGVRASEALAPRRLPSLPAPLPPPLHPEQPPVYPAAPDGPDPFALDQLATDAATRAHALLGTGRDPVGELTLWQDAVRLAAARPGSGLTAGTRALYSSLASAAGRTPAELARAVAAWRQGGLDGLGVLEEPWDPPAGRFDRARPLLLAADLPAFRPWRNRLTHPRGHVQLRLGRDGLWYAYESEPGQDDWWPRGTPDLDPVGALTGLDTPDAL